jgi:hypothetical protein
MMVAKAYPSGCEQTFAIVPDRDVLGTRREQEWLGFLDTRTAIPGLTFHQQPLRTKYRAGVRHNDA